MSTTFIIGNVFDLIGVCKTSCLEFFDYIFFLKNDDVHINFSCYNVLLSFIYLFICFIIVSYICTLYVNFIQIYKPDKIKKYHIKYKRFFHLVRATCIPISILLSIILIFLIAIDVFNNGHIFGENSISISKDIEAWADFATCMTLPIALISFFYIYRTFQSQTLAARRSSFDTTFTQMFAQHNVLREKISSHNFLLKWKYVNLFSYFRYVVFNNKNKNVKELYRNFIFQYDLQGAVDFKNYFKYIYHEVQMVAINEYLNKNVKRRYIKLIQGQMNNDELFCYLINQIEYLSRINDERSIEYALKLKEYDFFEDLCKDCNYKEHIIAIQENNFELNNLIKCEWIK